MDNRENTLRTTGLRATMLLLLMVLSNYLNAQTHTMVYDVDDFVKGYSIEMCTDYTTNNGETVQVGTIYNYPSGGETAVHFMNVADDGTVNYSKYIDAPSGYQELRAVDIVGDLGGGWGASPGAAIYYITCLGRTASSNDRVIIIPVDYKGDMVDDAFVLYPSDGNGNVDDNANIYPLHSIYLQSTGDVYVCGYYTTDQNGTGGTSLSGSGEPDFTSDKFGFILRAEINSGTWSGFILYGINQQFVNNQTTPTDDYDIAMRLVKKNNGDIFITGSVNDVKHDGVSEYWHSATMNVTMRDNLSLNAGTWHRGNFTNGAEAVFSGNEYGIGLVEEGPSNAYIVGNYFYRFGNNSLFDDIEPAFYWINWVDGNFDHTVTGDSRLTFVGHDYAWALQTLEGPALDIFSPNNAAVRFLIPGITVNDWCSSNFDEDDARTFIHDIEVDYNDDDPGNIGFRFRKWTTFLTQNGTGVLSNSNSYYHLGGGISNIAWNPTMAARENTSEDIYLTAPTLLQGPDRLAMKNIRIDYNDANMGTTYLTDDNCTNSFTETWNPAPPSCVLPYSKESAYDLGYGTVVPDVTSTFWQLITADYTTIPSSGTGTMNIGNYTINNELDCASMGGPYYKPAGIKDEQNSSFKIYPNPASNMVAIGLASGVSGTASVTVVMTDIYGRNTYQLYTGDAQGLNNKQLQLPDVPVGLYILQITADGQLIHTEKLGIQQ